MSTPTIQASMKERRSLRQGQNCSVIICFNVAHIINDLGSGGTWSLMVQMPRDSEATEINDELTVDGCNIYWLVSEQSTSVCGELKTQLTYSINGKIVKDHVYSWNVLDSL